jgi:nitrate/nitrite transport system ATP-binding protein
MAFLEAAGLGKSYGEGSSRTEVLRGVDLEVAEGELVAILGYSGAGKSTLLSLLSGLLRPDAGTVTFRGERLTRPTPALGVVFQSYSLLPWLTVEENVRLAVDSVFPAWDTGRRNEHVLAHIDKVGLTPARTKRPAELSGGMRQRVAVARALAMEPAGLLMDEPFGALDALTRATLQDEIARLWLESRRTIVLVTNDIEEALLLADRVIPLGHGPAAALGPAVSIDWSRPRDRRELSKNPGCRDARARVLEYLLHSGGRRRAPVAVEDVVALAPRAAADGACT